MDDILELTLLYDFYGELLTPKQKLVYEMYYQNDLSLSEIGQELSISRQAVRDQLKRTEGILYGYEQKLQLVSRFLQQQRAVRQMKQKIEELEKQYPLPPEGVAALEKIKGIADEILD